MSRLFLIITACVSSLSATSAHAMSGAEVLKAVNHDSDQTLEMDEWLTVARTRFNAADANHDGKLDVKELDSSAGQSLVKMMVK